uniref:5'-methylthioadenosine/S-adenosylhomocysteine nucleosidase n=1 Tax=Talaromyces marneffei PM1 TaxID=1077442 RepID=A0A093V612_TALMA
MSASHAVRIEDYTIGWVCALFTELAAAQDMLDERHSDTHVHGLDTNIYTLGSICGHKVVIACLPDGQIGVGSAAAVAAQMKSTFPSIQFGLMVGVGGGVPTVENDIRLGDVVVSRPDKGHGGVVQYDFGKNTPGGFQRTGFLNSPPQILLKAIAKMRSNHLRGESKVLQYASTPRAEIESPGQDILFEADSCHIGGPICEKCDRDKIVRRKPRANQEPVIHYGTIASGSQVMRYGIERDRVSSEFGGVLCFEMEAAGLMNILPCLVIRGICDYADSHKNKAWQRYAARMAAAYAKELLSRVPTTEVKKPPVTDNKMVHFHLLPDLGVCPFESIMTAPYFGWSDEYIATGIQAVAKAIQTLEEDDDDELFAEAVEFLHEFDATLKDIQRYESEFPSGQFTTDITRLLQIMKSPLDRLLHFLEVYYPTVSSQISKSNGDPESKNWSFEGKKLFGKIIELKDAISHSLKLVHTLLWLHGLENVVKVIRHEIPVMEPDAANVAAKFIQALNSIDNTKLGLNIESLKSRQKYEKAMQFGADSTKQGISPILRTRSRKVRTGGLRSKEMIFAIEVLRQELHRSTGIILDTLIGQMENPSNDSELKGLLELHKQSFVTIHESLKSSWMATNEIEELIRQLTEKDATGNMSSWITTWTASLLGAVIGSIATTMFGMSLNHNNEPQLCDISSLIQGRDMGSRSQNKEELCPRCEHSKVWIFKNDMPDIGDDSKLARSTGPNTDNIDFEEPPLPSVRPLPFKHENADRRITPSLSSAYTASHLHDRATESYLVRYTTELNQRKF